MKNGLLQSRRHFLKASAGLASFFIVPRHVLGRGYVAPSDQIALGFIGLGRQVGGLRTNFLKRNDARIVAACDVDRSKIAQFTGAVNKHYADQTGQGRYDGCRPYDDFRALLASPAVDAVVIVTPDHWHGVMAVRAAEAGKDIYCEKPLSLTVAEGRAMVRAVRRHKRVLQTGSMQRSWAEFRQAVELVRNGYIGEVRSVTVNVGGPPKPFDLPAEPTPADLNWAAWLGPNVVERPYNAQLAPPIAANYWAQWRAYQDFGGGGMTDWGAHMFDIAQWGLDMDHTGPTELIPPTRSDASDGSGKGLVYKYANGVVMTHQPQAGKQFCRFTGTEGEVTVARGELTTTPSTLKDKVIGGSDKRVYVSDNHYADFLTAIRTRQRPVCDVEIGHRTASVCNIGNIAYALGRPLRWDPDRERFRGDRDANRLLKRPLRPEWRI